MVFLPRRLCFLWASAIQVRICTLRTAFSCLSPSIGAFIKYCMYIIVLVVMLEQCLEVPATLASRTQVIIHMYLIGISRNIVFNKL